MEIKDQNSHSTTGNNSPIITGNNNKTLLGKSHLEENINYSKNKRVRFTKINLTFAIGGFLLGVITSVIGNIIYNYISF